MNVLYVKLKPFIHASLVTCQFVIVQLVVQQRTQNIEIIQKNTQKKLANVRSAKIKVVSRSVCQKKNQTSIDRQLFPKTAEVRFFVLFFIIIQNSFAHKGRISNDKSR